MKQPPLAYSVSLVLSLSVIGCGEVDTTGDARPSPDAGDVLDGATGSDGAPEIDGGGGGDGGDTTPPDTFIVSGPDSLVDSLLATFTFSSNEADVTFECQLDSAAYAPCSPPADLDVVAGPHQFRVRAVDAALNVDPTPAEWTWTAYPAPILHFAFEDNTENQGSLDGYDGSGFGVTYQPGKLGRAIKFGTTGSYLSVPGTREPLSAGADYTIGLWFRTDAGVSPGSPSRLLSFMEMDDAGGGGVQTYYYAGVALISRVCYAGTPVASACADLPLATGGAWVHLLIRHDGASTTSGGDVEIWRDGVLYATLQNDANAVIFSANQALDLLVGAGANSYVDDLRIYDRVFTPAEQCWYVLRGVWSGSSCTLP